ncbi:MAG: ABC transporter substrate-binding protein [Lachnospiraceae bacterium]
MKKRIVKRMLSLAAAAVLATSLFAGCGSSQGTEDTSEASDTTEAADETQSEDGGLDKVTFVSPTALESFDYLAIYVGDYLGYFEDEGIDVEYVEQLGSDDMKMLAAGTAQFAYPSPGVMWSSIDAGITDVKAITNYDSIQIFGLAVNKDSGITSFDDLKGQTVALGADAWTTLLAPIINGAGLTMDDINFVTYGTGSYEAVASNAAPVLGTWLSEYRQLVGQGYDFDYLDGNTVAPQVSNALCTSQALIDEDPDLVQRFVNAFTKAMYFCYNNVEAAADITLLTCPNLEIDWAGALGAAEGDVQQIFGISEEDQAATIEAGIGMFDMEMAQNAADNLLEAGAISNEYNAEDYYTNDFASEISWDKAEVEADAAAYESTSPQYTEAN